LIRKLRGGILPSNFFGDQFQLNTAEDNVVLPSAREPKRRFVPSKWEAKTVLRIIRSLRKNPDQRRNDLQRHKAETGPALLWEGDDDLTLKINGLAYLPAPRAKLPTHSDSYSPPFEYRADTVTKDNGDVDETPRTFYEGTRWAFPKSRLPVCPYGTDTFFYLSQPCGACRPTPRSCWSDSSGVSTFTCVPESRKTESTSTRKICSRRFRRRKS